MEALPAVGGSRLGFLAQKAKHISSCQPQEDSANITCQLLLTLWATVQKGLKWK